jgi:hypothetical protein
MIPDVTSLMSLDKVNRQKLDTLAQSMKAGYNNMLKANGLGAPQEAQGPEIKTMGGVKYQKVQGGWQRLK